ncbi:MAG: hypothetical protein ABFC94_14900 [Syntrophomonas sp.]
MINLNFFHKLNHTGEMLIDILQKKFNEDFFSRVISIEGTPFLHIKFYDKESTIKRVMNPPQPIKNCCNPEIVAAILELNNIVFENKDYETIIKSYDILIFDMSVISVRQLIISDFKSPDKYIRESECPKAVELGKKAVYLLGLDYAMITVAVTGKRKFKVLNIDPSPVIRKKDLNSLVSKLESLYYHSPSQEFRPVKLGADPEFMLFNSKSGKMVAASEFFPRDGIVGCDSLRIPNRQQRPVAEIRPNPELSPHILIDNIRHALKTANKMAPYRKVKWVAGSHPTGNYSIGGHIHFSNIDLNYSLLKALDNYVGIPVFLIENPISAARRRKKYGLLADFRVKDYGGFEYRTPGSWLVSPQLALAILCLAKIVATHHMELTENYLDNYEAQSAFYQGNQNFFRPIFEHLWSNISSTETYLQYNKELKIIYYMVINSIIWDENNDFREVWKISASTKRHYKTTQYTSENIHEMPRRSGSSIQNRDIIADLQSTNTPVNTSTENRHNIEGSVRNSLSSSRSTAGHMNQRNEVSQREIISNYTRSTRIL